jgi:hypothetical protein
MGISAMLSVMLNSSKPSMLWLCRTEIALGIFAIAWLQLVGVVTSTIVHHILHALPLAVIMLIPPGEWTRQLRALSAIAWIIMLAVITPMIHYAIREGITFSLSDYAFTWLAPGMVLISILWAAANIALLSNRMIYGMLAILVLTLLALGGAFMQPMIADLYLMPIDRVIVGQWIWIAPLIILVPVTLGFPWLILYGLMTSPRPKLTRRSVIAQAAYWLFFLTCMIAGLHPSVN